MAIVNALDPALEVVGGAVSRDRFFITCPDRRFRHRRLREVVRHSDPAKDLAAFARDIIDICRRRGISAVLPSGTTVTNALSRCKTEVERESGAVAVVEDYGKLERLTDKWHSYCAAVSAGVGTPHTVLLDDTPDLSDRLASLRFPAVIKPRMSYASIGVSFADSREHLDRWLAIPESRDGSHIVQERIDGDLHDANACGQDGRALCVLSQQRLLSLYDFGGGGIINLTTDEPVAREYARIMLAATRWNGPIQFEFMRDREGRFYLIECNPKFWGTTYLTVAAGMNVVQLALDAFLQRPGLAPIERYEIGLLYRWLFPECTFNWIQKPRTPSRIWHRLRDTFRGRGERRSIQNLNMTDLPHLIGIIFDRAQL